MSFNVLISTIPICSAGIKAFFFENKTRQCTVFGHSMEPFLSLGESIEIVPCAAPLKKARCYAFITGNTLTIHRFVKNYNNGYALFAGDSSLFCDLVPLQNIVGELFPCQRGPTSFIIGLVNYIFSVVMQVFSENIAIRRLRRRIIKCLKSGQERFMHEKEI